MGKKAATKRGSASPGSVAVADEHEAGKSEVQKLRDEGNKHFGRKDYQKALEAYDRALKASDKASDKAEAPLLHSNKAACFMMLQRLKEAINECTSALDLDPSFAKALIRRAKAHEAMGHYKQALSDIQKANKADSANPDTQEAEKRLKDLVSGKAKGNGVLAANGVAGKKGPTKGRQQQIIAFPVKATLGSETRQLAIMGQTTYADLLEQLRLKFPAAGPFAVKYLDKEGDLVTVTDRGDVAAALEEVVRSAERLAGGSGGSRPPLSQMLPPLRLQLVPVGSADEVPQPPAEERAALAQMQQARRVLTEQARQGQAARAEEKAEPQPEPYELDQWIVDFAGLFRDSLGIEPDRHLDLQNIAWDKMQAALDSAVLSDKAPTLFAQAADRFQDVAAHGLLQWGNVHLCEGKRVIDKAAAAGRDIAKVADEAEALFAKAEDRFREALRTKPNFYDGAASMGNLQFERGKLAAGFAILPPKPDQPADKQADAPEPGTEPPKGSKAAKEAEEARAAALQAATQAQLKAALGRLSKASLAKGEPFFQKAWAHFAEAIEMLPEEERGKPLKQQQEGAPPPTPAEEEAYIWAHCQVMWGNLLYELSQMRAAVGAEWRPTLDEATAKFRGAGCPEADIRQALASHTQKEHLDLGPEPQPEQATKKEEAPAAKAAEGEKVKGLPSLGPKPKKKAAAES